MESKVFNGDCLELMKDYPDSYFELAICDPPYGINAGTKNTGRGWVQRKSKGWDKEIPIKDYFQELFRVSKNQIIWGGNYLTPYLSPSMGWILWDKGQRNFSLADGELAYTSFNRALRIFTMSRAKDKAENDREGGRIHPTQKPIRLYEWLLANYAKEGDKILDTHLGSGSSRIAAHNLKFDFVGFELDKEYFDASEFRYQEHIKQLTLF